MHLLRRLVPAFAYFALACLFLWRVVFGGQVFVPAGLLHYLAPWTSDQRPPWNPLLYDSVGQFYPWRHFAAESVRSGTLPLWNPYQFSGTPFVANSQSAVFYPGNLLFYLLPTATAAGWSVILHLTLAGSFTYIFLRGLGLSKPSSILGGLAYCFSTWQVSWLHLPTFLATSCWLPLVLHFTLRTRREANLRNGALLALAVGMTLLAGHLQIAFYVLLAAAILAIWPGPGSTCRPAARRPPSAVVWFLAILAGALLAAPQVLPSLELSRQSHRAASASAAGYEAYTGYAVNPASLVTLYLPDFFGNPSNPDSAYSGKAQNGAPFNYAEGATYVGIPTLLLAALAVLEARKRSPIVGYCAAIGVLAMAVALGTVVDRLLYFYVPGFSQSGSPGRMLVLWAFATSVLAAYGCEEAVSGRLCKRGLLGSLVLTAIAMGLLVFAGLSGAGGTPAPWEGAAVRAVVYLAITAVVCHLTGRDPRRIGNPGHLLLPALVFLDLSGVGVSYNPTSAREDVYRNTPLITYLQQHAGHDRVMPVNPRHFSFAGPNATLPPNGAMVFGLRDVQGYDSLFPGQYKAFMNQLAAPVDADASPPEVGNMVFAKNPASPLVPVTGARIVVSRDPLSLPSQDVVDGLYVYELSEAPGRARLEADGSVNWRRDDPTRVEIEVGAEFPTNLVLADQDYPGWTATVNGLPAKIERSDGVFRKVAVSEGHSIVQFAYRPASFLVGLYLALASLAASIGCLIATRGTRRINPGAE